jgi:fumarate reductase (CoM/CoB) subunit A
MNEQIQHLQTDVLIVGAGLAALRAAIEAQRMGRDVMMITKGIAGRAGSSAITSAGFTVAIGVADPTDTPELHFQDTIRGGGSVNNHRLARIFCDEAVDRFGEMVEWGVEFDRDPETGKYIQHLSGDHSKPRVTVCATHKGTGMTLPLKQAAAGVNFVDRVMALDLMQDEHGVSGVIGLDTRDLELIVIQAKTVILGTGGIGRLYPITSNPNDVTGDGLALAYRAGATLTDLEFVQFYPWRLISHVRSRMPIQPSSFASGAMLRNAQGLRFMEQVDSERKEATTRDFAARGIYTEIVEGRGVEGGVVLDLSEISLDIFARLNPRVAKFFEQHNYDLAAERLLLAPEAHYHMGGVRIDENSRTSLPYLYAVGESSAGIHGGNRLDSNEIPAGQVFGRRGGMAAAQDATSRPEPKLDTARLAVWKERLAAMRGEQRPALDPKTLKATVADVMWRSAGIIRRGATLTQGITEAKELRDQIAGARVDEAANLPEYIEAENMALVAELVIRAATLRTESRSAHYREDFPARNDDDWLVNIRARRDPSRAEPEPVLTTHPVEIDQSVTLRESENHINETTSE